VNIKLTLIYYENEVNGEIVNALENTYNFVRGIYTKHKFCVMQPNLCRSTKIEAFQFVLYGQILGRTTQNSGFMYANRPLS
jgi:hypothetical protein